MTGDEPRPKENRRIYKKLSKIIANKHGYCYNKNMRNGYVYIMTNHSNEVLYVGVTSDIIRRLNEHRNHLIKGFTDKYNLTKVVYVEVTDRVFDAIKREKQIKGWLRQKKIDLIKEFNPEFKDLYDEIVLSCQ